LFFFDSILSPLNNVNSVKNICESFREVLVYRIRFWLRVLSEKVYPARESLIRRPVENRGKKLKMRDKIHFDSKSPKLNLLATDQSAKNITLSSRFWLG